MVTYSNMLRKILINYNNGTKIQINRQKPTNKQTNRERKKLLRLIKIIISQILKKRLVYVYMRKKIGEK